MPNGDSFMIFTANVSASWFNYRSYTLQTSFCIVPVRPHVLLLVSSPSRWRLWFWGISWTWLSRGEWKARRLSSGLVRRKSDSGRFRWPTGVLSSSPSSTWPARWPNHRASLPSLWAATRTRAAAPRTARPGGGGGETLDSDMKNWFCLNWRFHEHHVC